MFALEDRSSIRENKAKLALLLRGFFQPETIKEGIQLFERGKLIFNQEIKKNRLIAQVGGNDWFDVQIQLDYLPYSKCNCRNTGSCEHMASVIFKYIKDSGVDIEHLAIEYGLGSTKYPTLPKERTVVPVNTKSTVAWVDLLTESTDYNQWHQGFELMLPYYSIPVTDLPSYMDKVTAKLFAPSQNWKDHQLVVLYKLHALLYAMRLAERCLAYYKPGSANVFDDSATELMKSIFSQMDLKVASKDRYYMCMVGLTEKLGHFAFSGETNRSLFNWLFSFRLIWTNLPLDSSMQEKERKRLIKEADQKPKVMVDLMMAAAAHFHVIAGDDHAAMDFLDARMDKKFPYYFYDYINLYSFSEDWEKLRVWLGWLHPLMKGAPDNHLSYFLNVWRDMVDKTWGAGQKEWQQAIMGLMPNSSRYYGAYLLEKEDYVMWIDLQLWLVLPPDELDSKTLSKVEAKAPHFLLPFYHQLVYRYIQQKNREAYREAVTWMKKLRKLYKKLKMQRDWEIYVDCLKLRYSRLNALQEEMRKWQIIR